MDAESQQEEITEHNPKSKHWHILIVLFVVIVISGIASMALTNSSKVSSHELSKADGENGHNCWVAVDGVVYDLSSSFNWENGEHVTSEGLASCGRDLSDVIDKSPHGRKILDQLNVVGRL